MLSKVWCLSGLGLVVALLSGAAGAATVSKDVDIIVTHAAPGVLTTSTYVNASNVTAPAGTPLLMAQAFRRGDVFLDRNCAVPRNATTHNPLVWQHDNTATRLENGDDKSVRHWAFGVLTDADVPAGGKYSIEWVSTGAACPAPTAHQDLAKLAAAHDLKIRFSNVVNQDLTMRGSGSLTFDVNQAVKNTGRDAPSKYATGPVYDGWRVVGPPTLDTASSGRLIGAMLSPAQMTLSNWTGITGGSVHVVVDGKAVDVTGINLSAAKNMADVAAAINARLSATSAGATMSFDANDQSQRFQLFSNSTGTSSTVSFLTAAASGTDLSTRLLMNSSAASYNSQVNGYTQAGLAAGSKDPLLYVTCYVDVTTQSDGSTMGKVRTSCGVYNGWMNVAAGTTGNAGNPGPAGYANDPQMVIYGPALMDGTHPILDYVAMYSASLNSASSPVYQPGAADACANEGGAWTISSCWNIPASTADTPWILGGTHVFQTTGVPPTCEIRAGFGWDRPGGACSYVPGHYYGDYPIGTAGRKGIGSTYVTFSDEPVAMKETLSGALLSPTSQGTGTHTFSYRVSHVNHQVWRTFTSKGFAPWSDGTAMSVSPFDVAFDQGSFGGERLYWEETGTIPPIKLSQPVAVFSQGQSNEGNDYYMPMGRGNLIGGSGGGERPELDVMNQYAAACWVTMAADDCLHARTLSLSQYPFWAILNEATGYVPALNNGPPTGAHGEGGGGSYPVLGTPFPAAYQEASPGTLGAGLGGMVPALEGTPINLGWNSSVPMSGQYWYGAGFWYDARGTQHDHEPEVAGISYRLYGNPQFLEAIYNHAERTFQSHTGHPTLINGANYYGDTVGEAQGRGGAWMVRDRTLGAAFGGDERPERQYFSDGLKEAGSAFVARLAEISGPATGSVENALFTPGDELTFTPAYLANYTASTGYMAWTMLHSPLGKNVVDRVSRQLQATCGHSIAEWPAFLPDYHCTTYWTIMSIRDARGYANYGSGIGVNSTDATDVADAAWTYTFAAGSGRIVGNGVPMTVGDKIRNIPNYNDGLIVDQLDADPAAWYDVLGPVDASNGFFIRCPVGHAVTATCPTPGAAFTGFTSGGAALSVTDYLETRNQFDNGSAEFPDYIPYRWQAFAAGQITGHDMSAAIAQSNARYGALSKDGAPDFIWDPTVKVP